MEENDNILELCQRIYNADEHLNLQFELDSSRNKIHQLFDIYVNIFCYGLNFYGRNSQTFANINEKMGHIGISLKVNALELENDPEIPNILEESPVVEMIYNDDSLEKCCLHYNDGYYEYNISFQNVYMFGINQEEAIHSEY